MTVVHFTLENVIEYLKSNGFVYTIRGRRKHLGKVTILYKGKLFGVGEIEEVGRVDLNTLTVRDSSLEEYLPYSGFTTLEDWVTTALRLNSKVSSKELWLYKVKLVRCFWRQTKLYEIV